MNSHMIEVKKLEKSPLNARRTVAKGAAEELKASILAHGLMMNLMVTEAAKGKYRVIAGGRRLAALKALQKDGKLPADHAVACQIVTAENALELSLAENTVRLAMHPADEFEAFATLSDQGQSSALIAQRFGVEEKHVLQRLKLGRVAPALLKAYRDGELTLDRLMAFAISDDHAKQLQVFDALEVWHEPRDIRAMLTEQLLDAASPLAAFVGIDAYLAAGGITRSDLFEEEVFLENPELLHRLAADKLAGIRQELAAEGWAWVETRPERDYEAISRCRRIQPQPVNAPQELIDLETQLESELEALEAALEDTESDELLDRHEATSERLAEVAATLASFVAYDPQGMQRAGCYVSIARDGTPFIERGLVRPEDDRQDDDHPAGSGTVNERPAKAMPETLRRDLEAYRLHAAQAEIAKHPQIAFDLLVFKVACSAFASPAHGGPDVHFRRHHPAIRQEQDGDELAGVAEALPLAWLEEEAEAGQFAAFRRLAEADKLALLAYSVATSLQPQLATGREATAYEQALTLTAADMAAYWRPTRDNYLGRISRDQLLALGQGIFGEPWSQSHRKDKKGELANHFEKAFANPQGYARNPQQLEALKRWLPAGMAFGHAGEPPASDRQEAA